MQKKHTRGILVVGIIVLFIGAGIHPAFAVDTKKSIVNKASEEDCCCVDVSATDLVKVERLLDRVEVYSKLLLVLSKYNPEIQEEIEELLDLINPDSLWDFPIICNILNGTLKKLVDIFDFFDNFFINWIESTEEGTFERQIVILCFKIYENIWENILLPIFGIVFITGVFIGCWEWDPYPVISAKNLITNKRNHISFRILDIISDKSFNTKYLI